MALRFEVAMSDDTVGWKRCISSAPYRSLQRAQQTDLSIANVYNRCEISSLRACPGLLINAGK